MNNIIKSALSAKFNASDIDALMEVIQKTNNAEVATELLLGIYQQPDVNLTPHPDAKGQDFPNMMFDFYDKWTDKVHYTYDSIRKNKEGVPIETYRSNNCMKRTYWNTGKGSSW